VTSAGRSGTLDLDVFREREMIYNLVELVGTGEQFSEYVYSLLAETDLVVIVGRLASFIKQMEEDVVLQMRTELSKLRVQVQD
jgi:hypothetical protein